MTGHVPVEQLLKFVSVRPPKPAPEPRILDDFIPYDVDPEPAPLAVGA